MCNRTAVFMNLKNLSIKILKRRCSGRLRSAFRHAFVVSMYSQQQFCFASLTVSFFPSVKGRYFAVKLLYFRKSNSFRQSSLNMTTMSLMYLFHNVILVKKKKKKRFKVDIYVKARICNVVQNTFCYTV